MRTCRPLSNKTTLKSHIRGWLPGRNCSKLAVSASAKTSTRRLTPRCSTTPNTTFPNSSCSSSRWKLSFQQPSRRPPSLRTWQRSQPLDRIHCASDLFSTERVKRSSRRRSRCIDLSWRRTATSPTWAPKPHPKVLYHFWDSPVPRGQRRMR